MNLFWWRYSLSIQARLVILILAAVLPAVGLASIGVVRIVNGERGQAERDVKERVEVLLSAVDREIGGVQVSLEMLASSPNLRRGDLEAFASQIQEALKVQGLAIGLHDTTAEELVSTTRPFGALPPRKTNREMVDYIVRTGKPHISNLFYRNGNATADRHRRGTGLA
jgi:hypothetical protein